MQQTKAEKLCEALATLRRRPPRDLSAHDLSQLQEALIQCTTEVWNEALKALVASKGGPGSGNPNQPRGERGKWIDTGDAAADARKDWQLLVGEDIGEALHQIDNVRAVPRSMWNSWRGQKLSAEEQLKRLE